MSSQRPKRSISKPSRYMTSSDEALQRTKTARSITEIQTNMQDDIHDIRRTIEDPIYSNNSLTQNNSHTYISSHTNIGTQTSHITTPQSDTNVLSSHQDSTIIQSHLQNETNAQSYIDLPACSYSFNNDIQNTHTHDYNTFSGNISYTDNSTYFQDNGNYGTRRDSAQNWYVGGSTGRADGVSPGRSAGVSIRESTGGLTGRSTGGSAGVSTGESAGVLTGGLAGGSTGGLMAHNQRNLTQEKSGIRKLQENLNSVQAEMKRMNSILEKIWTCVKNRRQAPQKPAIFPIVSLADMDIFEKFEEDEYLNAVNYLHYIGGFNLREAVNLSLKESLQDSVAKSFTWWGREGHRSLYNTRLIKAIYDGVGQNKHFEKPTRSEFQIQMREALDVKRKA